MAKSKPRKEQVERFRRGKLRWCMRRQKKNTEILGQKRPQEKDGNKERRKCKNRQDEKGKMAKGGEMTKRRQKVAGE